MTNRNSSKNLNLSKVSKDSNSRIFGSSVGMGRNVPRNSLTQRSPGKTINKFTSPEKYTGNNGQVNQFSAKKRLFDAKDYNIAECSLGDIELYKQVFDLLDQDHDGNLTPLDLRKCIRQYGGYKPGRQFVYVAMSYFDSDDGGQIDFKQFLKLMTTKPYQKDTEDDLIRVFQTLDQNNKGYIDQSDLLKLAEEMNQQTSIQEVRDAIRNVAPEADGKITLKQFIKFSRRKDFD